MSRLMSGSVTCVVQKDFIGEIANWVQWVLNGGYVGCGLWRYLRVKLLLVLF